MDAAECLVCRMFHYETKEQNLTLKHNDKLLTNITIASKLITKEAYYHYHWHLWSIICNTNDGWSLCITCELLHSAMIMEHW